MNNYDNTLKDKFKIAFKYSREYDYSESMEMAGVDDLDEEGNDVVFNDYDIDENLVGYLRMEIAFRLFSELVELDFTPSYSYLADFFYYGNKGVDLDIFAAEKYYLLGAQSDNFRAKVCLGDLYSTKSDDDQHNPLYDSEKAVKWYGETSNHWMSKYKLAVLLLDEELPVFDLNSGLSMLNELANDDISIARERLGIIYFEGNIVEKNYDTAYYYFIKDYNWCDGDISCDEAIYLAACYLNGYGTNTNINKSIELLRSKEADVELYKDYEHYNAYALCNYSLAMCHLNGIGLQEDKETAISYLNKAAAKNYAPALFQLSVLGLEPNIAQYADNKLRKSKETE